MTSEICRSFIDNSKEDGHNRPRFGMCVRGSVPGNWFSVGMGAAVGIPVRIYKGAGCSICELRPR